MATERYSEALVSLINTSLLPEELNFLEDGINTLLTDIFVNYSQDTAIDGSATSFNGIIRADKKLSYNLPGTELELILNSDFDPNANGYTSTIPFSIIISIAPFFKKFKATSFNGNPIEFLSIIIDYLNIDDEELLSIIITNLLPEKSIEALIDFINISYNTNPTIGNAQYDSSISNLVDSIYTNQTLIEEEIDCKSIFIAAFSSKQSSLQDKFTTI